MGTGWKQTELSTKGFRVQFLRTSGILEEDLGSSDTLLHQAIAAVKAGRRLQARKMLLEYVEQDPSSEAAWLWLSDLVIDLEDKIDALENAISINPSNAKVRNRLAQFKQQQFEAQKRETAAREPIYQRIIQDIQSDQLGKARARLLKMVEQNPQDERAWLLLSEALPEIEDQITRAFCGGIVVVVSVEARIQRKGKTRRFRKRECH